MIEILAMKQGDDYWNKTISFAENCSWIAGPLLADLMKKNRFLEWERVFVAYEDGHIAGYCTFTEKDEMPDKYDFSPFIGFVFVDEKYRGKRISEMMIKVATKYASECGYDVVYIMSGEVGLYEKFGFEKLGDYETIYGTVDQLFVKPILPDFLLETRQ